MAPPPSFAEPKAWATAIVNASPPVPPAAASPSALLGMMNLKRPGAYQPSLGTAASAGGDKEAQLKAWKKILVRRSPMHAVTWFFVSMLMWLCFEFRACPSGRVRLGCLQVDQYALVARRVTVRLLMVVRSSSILLSQLFLNNASFSVCCV